MILCFRCRRLFFLFTYFMFFYYIFIAIFHSILRILASIIFGTFLLPRIDYSVLPRKCQIIDLGKCFFLYRYINPAYMIGFEYYNINNFIGINVVFMFIGFFAYCGFLHLESSHTNPIAMVFISILQAESQHSLTERKHYENGYGTCLGT